MSGIERMVGVYRPINNDGWLRGDAPGGCLTQWDYPFPALRQAGLTKILAEAAKLGKP